MTFKFQDHYARMSNDELEGLARDYAQLTEEARSVLRAELQRRGLLAASQRTHEEEGRASAEAAREEDAARYFTVVSCTEKPGLFQVRTPRTTLYFPQTCPLCGSAADATVSVGTGQARGRRIEGLSFNIPHCSGCKNRINAGRSKVAVALLIGMIVVSGLIYWAVGDLRLALGFTVMGILLSYNLMRKVAVNIEGGIFMLDFASDSLLFAIKNRSYADEFCRVNLRAADRRPAPDVRSQLDLEVVTEISLRDAALGCQRTVTTEYKSYTLKIPAGIHSGQSLRLSGEGRPGTPPGDLYVVVNIL